MDSYMFDPKVIAGMSLQEINESLRFYGHALTTAHDDDRHAQFVAQTREYHAALEARKHKLVSAPPADESAQ